MKILCIDDTLRPDEIPLEKWVVEGREYTPIFWSNHVSQGRMGVELEEITLDESNKPYSAFGFHRFAIRQEDVKEWMMIGSISKKLLDRGLVKSDRYNPE